MTHLKIFLLIACLVFLTFGNALSNGFIGDDFLLFVGNDFYRNPANLSQLVSKDFVTTQEEFDTVSSPSKNRSYSGCVAYRPVTAISFFIDSFLWKLKPFGFHLTNIILHLITATLVYFLLSGILQNKKIAIFASALFALHPIQAEVVNNIGYRSDLIATLFYLLAMICFIRYLHGRDKSLMWMGGCTSFFIALLAKEIAVTLPLILLIYHKVFLKTKWREYQYFYISIFSILALYLYLYIIVFPNSTFREFANFSIVHQLLSSVKILSEYLIAFIIPIKVSVLPSFYNPVLEGIKFYEWLLIICFIFGCGFAVLRSMKQNKYIAFFAAWFFITYLPTANIIPIPSPMAYRFLYLPLIGLCVLTIILIEKILCGLKGIYQYALMSTLIIVCLTTTILVNKYYRNNFIVYHKMIEKYPEGAYPYLILGSVYKQYGHFSKAIDFYKKYLEKKPKNYGYNIHREDHEIHLLIGTCYVHDHDLALLEFLTAIELKEDYAVAYANAGMAYAMKKDYKQALEYIHKSLELEEGLFNGFVYGVDVYLMLGQKQEAMELLERGLKHFPGEPMLLNRRKL